MFEKAKFQWQPIAELVLMLATILGSTIVLYIHTDNKVSSLVQAQNNRTDKLYEMFIDLLKERK